MYDLGPVLIFYAIVLLIWTGLFGIALFAIHHFSGPWGICASVGSLGGCI